MKADPNDSLYGLFCHGMLKFGLDETANTLSTQSRLIGDNECNACEESIRDSFGETIGGMGGRNCDDEEKYLVRTLLNDSLNILPQIMALEKLKHKKASRKCQIVKSHIRSSNYDMLYGCDQAQGQKPIERIKGHGDTIH